MAAPAFRYSHRVTYAECTIGNHIYYSRYLDLLEAARGEFFRSLGASALQCQEQGALFPVIECRIRYRAPARYDDVLAIDVRVAALDRVRLNFACQIFNQADKCLVEAETFHVCTGLDEKPRRIPDDLASKLAAHLRS